MTAKILYLIDANAFCYRAYFAMPGLCTSYGQPTGAIYGFLNILNKVLKEKKPEYIGVCFDVSRKTFRQKKFAEYKINRQPMPDELVSQIPLIKSIIAAYGIKTCEKEGFEADDVIATLSERAGAEGMEVVIVSNDKDILQLVSQKVSVLSPQKDKDVLYDKQKVVERFGLPPEKIVDVMALMGDEIDNIPGVRGIGEKTAVKLIQAYGSVEALLRLRSGLKQEKLSRMISDSAELIELSRELAILDKNVELELGPQDLRRSQADNSELFRIFRKLEFKSLFKALAPEEKEEDLKAQTLSKEVFLSLLKRGGELALYGLGPEELVFASDGRIFAVEDTAANAGAALADKALRKTGFDLKKTAVSLARRDLRLAGFYFDAMIAAHLLDPAKPVSGLADVVLDHLDKKPSPGLSPAAALSLVLELKPVFEKELRAKDLYDVFSKLEMPLAEVLTEMEITGVKLDLEVLSRLSRDIEKRLVKLIEEIYDSSGTQFNINSPKQLREVLFEKLKLPVGRRTKTGPSTDEEVLRGLSDKHRLPALLLEYRQLTKLKNTYIDTLPALVDQRTGRLHTSFNQTVTETGRLSSSNPNLQNIPIKTDIGSNIRRAIIASADDWRLVSCDYSQVELRILAHLSGDKALAAAFNSRQDIHRATAALIYGIEEKEVTPEMREMAKRVNFGIVYGLSPYGLSRDLDIPVDEASTFIEAYFARYPGVREYIDKEIEAARKKGFVTTLMGRRRYIPEINNKNQGIRSFAERQAVNTPIQGTAADLIKLAMVHIHDLLKSSGMRARMVLQVHDELVFDAPAEELGKLCECVRDRMENVLELSVPVKVDMKYGRNWLEMTPCPEEG